MAFLCHQFLTWAPTAGKPAHSYYCWLSSGLDFHWSSWSSGICRWGKQSFSLPQQEYSKLSQQHLQLHSHLCSRNMAVIVLGLQTMQAAFYETIITVVSHRLFIVYKWKLLHSICPRPFNKYPRIFYVSQVVSFSYINQLTRVVFLHSIFNISEYTEYFFESLDHWKYDQCVISGTW